MPSRHILRVGTGQSPDPPGGANLVFASDWSTGTGQGATARLDGTKWDEWEDFGSPQILEVVSASGLGFPAGMDNALRIWYTDHNTAHVAVFENWTQPAVGESVWYRLYWRNDVTDEVADIMPSWHGVETYYGGCVASANWSWGSGATSTPGNPFVFLFWTGGNGTHPMWLLRGANRLTRGAVYRIEWEWRRTATSEFTLHPRVYDSGGTLIRDGSHFISDDNVTSIDAYQNAGGRHPLTLMDGSIPCMRRWLVGSNGSQFSGGYMYYGGAAVSRTSWCGAYSAGEGP